MSQMAFNPLSAGFLLQNYGFYQIQLLSKRNQRIYILQFAPQFDILNLLLRYKHDFLYIDNLL